MSTRTIAMTEAVYAYFQSASLREPELLRRLRDETRALGDSARMQICPEQGQLMALLARLTGARRILEIGTFTGYSALALALALPEDGRIVACDLSADWTAVARRYWAEAGVAGRIELRLAPALETLAALRAEGWAGGFDMAFIDADKENCFAYYEQALDLLKSGGLIMIDNTLWGGRVADPEQTDADTVAIRRLNERLRDDTRIDLSMVPIGDGLTLARKR